MKIRRIFLFSLLSFFLITAANAYGAKKSPLLENLLSDSFDISDVQAEFEFAAGFFSKSGMTNNPKVPEEFQGLWGISFGEGIEGLIAIGAKNIYLFDKSGQPRKPLSCASYENQSAKPLCYALQRGGLYVSFNYMDIIILPGENAKQGRIDGTIQLTKDVTGFATNLTQPENITLTKVLLSNPEYISNDTDHTMISFNVGNLPYKTWLYYAIECENYTSKEWLPHRLTPEANNRNYTVPPEVHGCYMTFKFDDVIVAKVPLDSIRPKPNSIGLNDLHGVWVVDEEMTIKNIKDKKTRKELETGRSISSMLFGYSPDKMAIDTDQMAISPFMTGSIMPMRVLKKTNDSITVGGTVFSGLGTNRREKLWHTATFYVKDGRLLLAREENILFIHNFYSAGINLYLKKIANDPVEYHKEHAMEAFKPTY